MTDDNKFDASEYDEPIAEHENHDDGMDEFWDEYGMPAQALLRLTYTDSSGETTERLFETKLFTEPSSTFSILGHCHMRNAERTLRIDKITHCVDEQTGKPVEDVYEYLFDLYEKTPDYSLDQVAHKHIDTLRAALHVASCAGLTESEQVTVIKQVCQQLARDNRITTEAVAKLCQQYQGGTSTGVDQTFRLIAGRLNKTLVPANKESVIRLCTKVAGLKGAVNSASQECIDYLAKRFSKPE